MGRTLKLMLVLHTLPIAIIIIVAIIIIIAIFNISVDIAVFINNSDDNTLHCNPLLLFTILQMWSTEVHGRGKLESAVS